MQQRSVHFLLGSFAATALFLGGCVGGDHGGGTAGAVTGATTTGGTTATTTTGGTTATTTTGGTATTGGTGTGTTGTIPELTTWASLQIDVTGDDTQLLAGDVTGDTMENLVAVSPDVNLHYRERNAGNTAWDVTLIASSSNNEVVSELGDIDADGDLDIAVLRQEGTNSFRVYWYENQGPGIQWPVRGPVTVALPNIADIALADLDNDNDLEIIVATGDATNPVNIAEVICFENPGLPTNIAWNQVSLGNTGNAAYVFAAAFNGSSNYNDVVVVENRLSGGNSLVRLNNSRDPNVNWTVGPVLTNIGRPTAAGGVADLNNDTRPDVYFAVTGFGPGGGTQVAMAFNNAGGNWSIAYIGPVMNPYTPYSVDVADYDADGDMDVVMLGSEDSGSTITALLLTNEGATYSAAITTGVSFTPAASGGSVQFTDIDEDGNIDIVAASNSTGSDAIFAWIQPAPTITKAVASLWQVKRIK